MILKGESSDMDRVILYTWQDVENYIYSGKNEWPHEWVRVDVYSDEIIIYANKVDKNLERESYEFISDYFKGYYSNGRIEIDVTDTVLNINFEEDEEQKQGTKPFPLFKDFSYVREENAEELPLLEKPVMAFHSYKGGVGRTLSLIIFVRNMIEKFGTSKKVLIVDGDIEAPGLTWLGEEQNGEYQFSYIDLLNTISAKGIDDDIYEKISHIVDNSYLRFHNTKLEMEQYFLPTYRYENQLLDIYSNPEKIMCGEKNKYIITEALAKLGAFLKVDMVLVDLRAGVSEYSAPLLFDPRVEKIVVTSTSKQSIVGTELLLKQLRKQKNNNIANIVLAMVNDKVISKKEKNEIYQRLLCDNKTSNDDITEGMGKMEDVVEVVHKDLLVHLGNMDEICDSLNMANEVTVAYDDMVKSAFAENDNKEEFSSDEIKHFRIKLNEITEKNVTAEADDKTNLLITKSVMQLGRFTREVPKINILGAKGSGKTYLYKQMLAAVTWNEFLNVIGKEDYSQKETLICPVICSEDRKNFIELINHCRIKCNENIPKINIKEDTLSSNENIVRNAIDNELTDNQWVLQWEQLIWNLFDDVSGWNELNEYLNTINKRIVFLFDGLETLLPRVSGSKTEKAGIKALCKNVINHIYEYQLDNIGMIVFLRKDIAELAIDVNFEQFRNQYQAYELSWSQADALKLAWRLSDNAANEVGIKLTEDDTTPIYNLSPEVIEMNLNKVWGKKMGPDASKTARTTRWVLASLSDFNGQLQARDIVRFLQYATKDGDNVKSEYHDRLLTPDIMKKAIKAASDKKLSEVKAEIRQLENSFKILEDIPASKKQVPLSDDVLDKLPNDDIKALERFGYLKEADGEYYIAENIRYALGYNKARRGGIKLVSLLVKK